MNDALMQAHCGMEFVCEDLSEAKNTTDGALRDALVLLFGRARKLSDDIEEAANKDLHEKWERPDERCGMFSLAENVT